MDASSCGFVELDNWADFLLRDSDAVVDWMGLGTEPLELDFPMKMYASDVFPRRYLSVLQSESHKDPALLNHFDLLIADATEFGREGT